MFLIISNALLGLAFSASALSKFREKPEPAVAISEKWIRLINVALALVALGVALLFFSNAYHLYTAPEGAEIQPYFGKLWSIALSLSGGLIMLRVCYYQYHKEPIEISLGSGSRILLKRGFWAGLGVAFGIISLIGVIYQIVLIL